MGYIHTVFMNVWLKEQRMELALSPETLLQFVETRNRLQYLIPILVGQRTPQSITLQCGFRYLPPKTHPAFFLNQDGQPRNPLIESKLEPFDVSFLDELKEDYISHPDLLGELKALLSQSNTPLNGIETVWIRWVPGIDSDVFDRIYHLDWTGASEERKCRYGYDLIRLAWNEEALGLASDTIVEIPCQGSYLARNSRHEYDGWETMPGLTTPIFSQGRSNWENFLSEFQMIVPATFSSFLPAMDQPGYVAQVQFLWQGRPVLCLKKMKPFSFLRQVLTDQWEFFFLDDWDNCLDEEWLIWNG